MSPVLIDTNIYSLAMRGDPEVTNRVRHIAHIGFSVIGIGELLAGFKGGKREQTNRQELYRFLDSPRVHIYGIDSETADFYADVIGALRRQGTPIPTNDVWIAALALQNGLKVFTRDKHFDCVPGLCRYG